MDAKRLNRSIRKRFSNEQSDSSEGKKVNAYYEIPEYKEDRIDYSLADNIIPLNASAHARLSRSDEDNIDWADFNIISGIDEK